MLAYTKKKIEQILKLDFLRFCMVGGLGFSINFVILIFLTSLFDLSIIWAQLIAAEFALGVNFILHNNWTYKKRRVSKSLRTLILQFHATTWPAILGSTAMVSIAVSVFHISKFWSLVISSLVSLMWNFMWTKYYIWHDREQATGVEAKNLSS